MHPVIAVVGVCAAGKSTLAAGLRELGFAAFSVPQEHSYVRRLWTRRCPDLLILLEASYETVCRRRPGRLVAQDQHEEQKRRLSYAYADCDIRLNTDPLTVAEVLAAALAAIQRANSGYGDGAGTG